MAEPTSLDLSHRPADSGGTFRAVLMAIFILPLTIVFGTASMVFGVLGLVRLASLSILFWSRGLLLVSGVKVKIIDESGITSTRSRIYLANHQSALDIPILFCALPHLDLRFMAKESLFNVPFMGWGMRVTGFIPIRRENPRHSAEVFKKLTATQRGSRYSYIVFPEGTRSPDGHLQPLKQGSIGLVVRLGYPVVPVSIVDACRANPKGTYKLRSGTIHVVFHKAIEIAETNDDGKAGREVRDQLREQVSTAIASVLPPDQAPRSGGSASGSSDAEPAVSPQAGPAQS